MGDPRAGAEADSPREERDRIADRLMRFMEKAESQKEDGNGDSNNPGMFG